MLAVVTSDRQPLSDNQLLTALALGDVVIMYGGHAPPAALVTLADSVAGPFTPVLAAAGQAVILSRSAGLSGVVGLAWTEMVRVKEAADPLLERFAAYWLGRGAGRTGAR